MNSFKNFFINVNLSIWAIIIALISIELTTRLVLDNKHPSGFTYQLKDEDHVPKPYVMATASPSVKYGNDTNNILGYRDFPKVHKNEDEFRIITLGGSTVHGGDVTLAKNIELQLSKEGYTNVKVYNAGVGSSVSRQDLIRIMFDFAGYQPDLIIHYLGGNDLMPAADPRINYPHRFVFYEGGIKFLTSASFESFIFSILVNSKFVKYFFDDFITQKIYERSNIIVPPSADQPKLRANSLAQNTLWSKLVSEHIGANYLTVFQPTLYYKGRLSDTEKSMIHSEETKKQLALRKYFFESKFLKNINILDCSSVFDNYSETIYTDPIHLIERFRAVPAHCITNYILKNKTLKKHKKSKYHFIPEEYFILGYPKTY